MVVGRWVGKDEYSIRSIPKHLSRHLLKVGRFDGVDPEGIRGMGGGCPYRV
jgi:hypothetical protein